MRQDPFSSTPTGVAGPPADGWRPVHFSVATGLAAALFLSWLIPGSRSWWDALDLAVFRFFNAQLAGPGPLQAFWAVTNWRPFDLVAAAIILGFVVAWLRTPEPAVIRARLAQFAAFCLLLLAGKVCEHLISDWTHYTRQSPTLVFSDTVRLSEIVKWVAVKDRGSTVFPGDHAFVIFAAVGFLWIHMKPRSGLLTAMALIPFTLPRIAVGAHWTTDVLVGGLAMALVLLGVGYATPLAGKLAGAVEHHATRPLAACIRLGIRLGILRGSGTG